jgi:hypothetical protein
MECSFGLDSGTVYFSDSEHDLLAKLKGIPAGSGLFFGEGFFWCGGRSADKKDDVIAGEEAAVGGQFR